MSVRAVDQLGVEAATGVKGQHDGSTLGRDTYSNELGDVGVAVKLRHEHGLLQEVLLLLLPFSSGVESGC